MRGFDHPQVLHLDSCPLLDRVKNTIKPHPSCNSLLSREKKLSIRAGSDFHDKGGTVRQVCAVTIHNKYNDDKEDYDYDIAILKVSPHDLSHT